MLTSLPILEGGCWCCGLVLAAEILFGGTECGRQPSKAEAKQQEQL